jgi:hypothetical protein
VRKHLMHLKIAGYLIGVAVLAAAALTYARAVAWDQNHHPIPLAIPISLAPGTIRTPGIKVDLDREFDIVIVFKGSHLRSERMNIDIDWQLWDDGKSVAHGNSANKPLDDWGDQVERTVGTFAGEAGHSYSLTLQVNPKTTQMDDADPILKVQIPRGLWEDYGVGLFLRRLESYVLAVIALLILGGSFLVARLHGYGAARQASS